MMLVDCRRCAIAELWAWRLALFLHFLTFRRYLYVFLPRGTMSSAIYSFLNSITNSITSRYDVKSQIATAGLWKIFLGLRKTTGQHVAVFVRSLFLSSFCFLTIRFPPIRYSKRNRWTMLQGVNGVHHALTPKKSTNCWRKKCVWLSCWRADHPSLCD